MNWFNGPFDSQDIVFGIKVYWLVRATNILQLVSGLFAASDLMSRSGKQTVYEWMAARKNGPERPRRNVLREVLKFLVLTSLTVAVASFFFALIWVFVLSEQPWQFSGMGSVLWQSLRIWPYMFVLLSIFGISAGASVAIAANGLLMVCRDSVLGFNYLMPKMARFFVPERFDNTVLWVSIALFVGASLMQIILS